MFYKISARHMGRSLAIALIGGMLLTLSSVCSYAQGSTASLNGTVKDATGSLIPSAKIVLVQTETNLTSETVSKGDGYFSFSSVPIAPYTLNVSKDGFAGFEQTGIVLTVKQTATLPIALNVRTATQEVVVTAGAPAVDSTDSTIQTVVYENVVAGLPLNGRNPTALVYTTPGVTDALINPKGTNANSAVAPMDAAVHQFYYHEFYAQQPDLNWRNPAVEKAMFASMRAVCI